MWVKVNGAWVQIAGVGATGPPADTASLLATTLVDAKGDLLVGTAADTVGRFAAGTNGYSLVADSTTASGLRWAPLTKRERCTANTAQSSNVTYSNPTGFAGIAVTSGRVYRIQCAIWYTSSQAGTGIRPSFDAPAMADWQAVGQNQTGATAGEFMRTTAPQNDLPFTAGLTAGGACMIDAVCKASANGTLNFRFRSETSGQTITVLAGSYWIVEEIVE